MDEQTGKPFPWKPNYGETAVAEAHGQSITEGFDLASITSEEAVFDNPPIQPDPGSPPTSYDKLHSGGDHPMVKASDPDPGSV